jgi:ATP-dependent Clp protease ATP-binding subunit ClpA
MQENLKKPLANELLFGSLVDGGSVKVELDKDKQKADLPLPQRVRCVKRMKVRCTKAG